MASQIALAVQNLPRNRRPRRVRPARFPRGIERQFVAANRAIARQQTKLISDLLLPRLGELARLAGVRQDEWRLDQSQFRALLREVLRDARQQFESAFGSAAETAEDAAREMSIFSRKEIGRQLRQVVGIDIFAESPELVDLLEQFVEENVSRIRTTSAANFETIENIVSRGFRSGQRAGVVGDAITQALGVSESRAAFWARDQIGSLNGQLTRARQTAIGVDEYIWRTSRDERVRETHRRLEGTKHSWDDPPTVGQRQVHPGEDYNCRCTADPVIPGLDNIETSPADVPRDPDLVKRKRERDRRRRQGLPPAVSTRRRKPKQRKPVPESAEPRTLKLPRTGRKVRLSAEQARRADVYIALADPQTRAAATTGQRLDRLLWSWVHGSRRKVSVELKQAAIREFRLRGIAYNPKGYRILDADVRQAQKDLRRLYNRTQKHLAEKGKKTVRVYRGIKSDVGTRGAVESWTTSEKTAREFAGKGGNVIVEDVPVERVLAVRGGPDWVDGVWGNQSEVMVLY